MAQSFRSITTELARKIKLIMADVDGTLTSSDSSFTPEVINSIHHLEEKGVTVGLVSGRELSHLDYYAELLGISGPLIGENGAIARTKKEGELVNLGFSREPALKALEKLQRLFPGAIEAGDWNKSRSMDLIIIVHGLSAEELRRHLDDADVLDSGYVLHLVQKGVSKGKTLLKIIGDMSLSLDEVMVFGDAPTDLSLFRSFPESVLVANPAISVEQGGQLRESARYISDACCGEGFAEVASYLLSVRNGTE